jgi:hypothetical protein
MSRYTGLIAHMEERLLVRQKDRVRSPLTHIKLFNMKQGLIFLAFITLMCSILAYSVFHKDSEHTLTYVIYYPNYNDTVTVSCDDSYFWSCDRGTNYIKEGGITGTTVYSGSAPYKILSYTKQ